MDVLFVVVESYFSSSSVISRAFSALCAYSKLGLHPDPLGYVCAKYSFFHGLRCWARHGKRSHTQSITHPAYLMSRERKLSLRNKLSVLCQKRPGFAFLINRCWRDTLSYSFVILVAWQFWLVSETFNAHKWRQHNADIIIRVYDSIKQSTKQIKSQYKTEIKQHRK